MPRTVAILIMGDGRGMILFDRHDIQLSEDMVPWAEELIATGNIDRPGLWMFMSLNDSLVGMGFQMIRIEEEQGKLLAVPTGDTATARMPRLTTWPPR